NWDLSETDETGDYVTRVVVRRPDDPSASSGTVLLEWLNVSGGLDANPDFAYLAPEILRAGHTWIGVSVQRVGVEGGSTDVSLKGTDAMAGEVLSGFVEGLYYALKHDADQFADDLYA